MKIIAILGYLFLLCVYIFVVIFIVKVLSYRENRDSFLSVVGVLTIIFGGIGLGILWYYGYPIINK